MLFTNCNPGKPLSAHCSAINYLEEYIVKRFIAFSLVLILLFCSTVALAAEADRASTRASDYFASYGMAVTIIGGGRLQLDFSCSSVGMASQLGVASYEVERKNSSGEWVDVTGLLSGSMRNNVVSHSFCKIFYGVPGERYRVKCTFACVKNGSSEYKNYTSGTRVAT